MKRVLYITHLLANSLYGGAETQLLKTMAKINEISEEFRVDLFQQWNDLIREYDIVHIFNPRAFPIESLRIARFSKLEGVKVVVTPVFYHHSGIEKGIQNSLSLSLVERVSEDFRKLLRRKYFSMLDPYANIADLLRECDLILPNTKEEMLQLTSFFDVRQEKFSHVPNGIDIDFKNGMPPLFEQEYGVKDFVLFVGRIEPHKNVLRLIKGFVRSGLDTHLVVLGKPTHSYYCELCKESSNERVMFLPPLPHDSDMLRSAYKSAKVIALPSYYETPGLAALEGGLSGANVVITKNGGTREYFGDYARYVDPTSVESIMEALVGAFNAPRSNGLSQYIEKNFTWRIVAEGTIKAYERIH
jgi:glycosyltransferase involved in cell wall biosynthesis